MLDNAGWHSPPGLAVPAGIRPVYLPPYSPELQPAERLWVHVDEPVANRHFDSLADLDAAVARQCIGRNADRDRIGPKPASAGGPTASPELISRRSYDVIFRCTLWLIVTANEWR